MKARDIYTGALKFLSESATGSDTADYEERAPYLLAAFCTDAKDVDSALRKALGKISATNFNHVSISLDSDFPLLDRLVPAAELYLAAMLVMEYDADASDNLYDKYCDCMARISSSILKN